MAKKIALTSTVSLAAAFAAAGTADINNAKVDLDLVGALQRAFKGRKATTAGYKEFYKATQRNSLVSYLTGRLAISLKAAEAVAELKGYKDDGEADKMRTFEQEQACAAFRQRWSRAIKKADVLSPETRGGNQSKAKEEVEEVAPIVPAPTTPSKADPAEYVEIQAAALLAFANKQPNAKKLTLAYKEAIVAFKKAIDAASASK